MPTVPVPSDVVVMPGAGLTITVDVYDWFVSAMEVAVTVTVKAEETDDGGVYTASVVVLPKLPQAFPLHAVPARLQVTPLLLGSLVTVGVSLTNCP